MKTYKERTDKYKEILSNLEKFLKENEENWIDIPADILAMHIFLYIENLQLFLKQRNVKGLEQEPINKDIIEKRMKSISEFVDKTGFDKLFECSENIITSFIYRYFVDLMILMKDNK